MTKKIFFPHRPPPIGGPGSFQSRFEEGLVARGWEVCYADEDSSTPDVVFVVAGTRRLIWLAKSVLRGAKVVHRLDGVNWQHRVTWPGLKKWITSEIRNSLVRGIRRVFADAVVYQSVFIESWWSREFGNVNKQCTVIYNGVSLSVFSPLGKDDSADSTSKVICVEGSVNGRPAVDMLKAIKKYRVEVFGNVDDEVKKQIYSLGLTNVKLMGPISRELVPASLAGRTVFLNLETNPPCPNAVIEALAAGVPVVGFDNGSLAELVGDAGVLLPYGNDPWRLQSPAANELDSAIDKIFENYSEYSNRARTRAERMFDINLIVEKYIQVIDGVGVR